jgi:hypothetical protein
LYGRTWLRRPRGTGNEVLVDGDTASIVLTDLHANVVGQAVIDVVDLDTVRPYRWYLATCRGRNRVHEHRYVCRGSDDLSLHRFLAGEPHGMEVDHIDNDGLNNRRANLRVVTRAQNAQNFARHGRETMRGISWSEKRRAWIPGIMINGRRIAGRECATLDEARAVVVALRAEHMPFANEARHK